MLFRCFCLMVIAASFGCSTKQEITVPTASYTAPTGTFKMAEAGGGALPGK
jgi:hypothetical protein